MNLRQYKDGLVGEYKGWLIQEIKKIPDTDPEYESDDFDAGLKHMKLLVLELLQ